MGRAKSIAFLSIGRGINAMVNLLFLPYMARALSYDDYATYGQILLIIEICLILISVANNQYLYILFSKPNQFNKKDVLLNSTLVNIVLSLIIVSALYFATPLFVNGFKNPKLSPSLLLYSCTILPSLLISTFNYVLYFFKRVKHALLIEVVLNLLRVSAIVIGVQHYKSIETVFVLLTIVHFAVLLFYFKKFPIHFWAGRFKKKIIKLFFKYGYTIGFIAITGILIKRTDGYMISSIFHPEDYAIYRMGAIEIPFLMTIFSSVTSIILPDVAKLFHQNKIKEIILLKRKASAGAAMVIYPPLIFILIFATPFLLFYLGNKYAESITIFAIYNIILFIRINDYRDILIAASKTRFMLTVDISIFLLNILLNLLFIYFFGILGAVIASVITLFILSSILLRKTLQTIKSSFFEMFDIQLISLTAFLSAGIGFIMFQIYQALPFIYLIPLLFFFYIVLVYLSLSILNKQGKEMIQKLLGHFLKFRKNG